MSASRPADPNSKLMLAWKAFQQSEQFDNAKKWAQRCTINCSDDGVKVVHEHLMGSLWTLFMVGYKSACEDAAEYLLSDGGHSEGPGSWADLADAVRTLDENVFQKETP